MSMTSRTLLAAGLILLALPGTAPAAEAAAQPVPITDPALLESLGFAPDATNVYATEQALRELAMSPAERAGALEAATGAGRADASSSVFGTDARSWAPVSYHEFLPISAGEYDTVSSSRYCVEGENFYVARIDGLAHGAKLQTVWIWAFDDFSAEDMDVTLRRVCQPDTSEGDPTETVLRMGSTFGTGGNTLIQFGSDSPLPPPNPLLDEDIDLASCFYELQVRFPAAIGVGCAGGSDLRIQKALAGWERQISPAPDSATFGDVPTGHLFFQHVEALAASGITAGCGGGDFCPNDPLTRGQMAAFLAKALGLHWTDISQ